MVAMLLEASCANKVNLVTDHAAYADNIVLDSNSGTE